MKYYNISFQYSETTYCSNIALAADQATVEQHYSNYPWYNITEATESDLREAERKGKPIIDLTEKEPETAAEEATEPDFTEIHESLAEELQAWYNRELQYIENGNESDPDAGLRRWSTDYMWNLYTSGERTAEVVEYRAVQRLVKAYAKKCEEAHEEVERIAEEATPESITVTIEWKRSSVWGLNPTATVTDGKRRTTGKASGCGYDKRSAAVADAFNANPRIKRILCEIKEEALRHGQTDRSRTACTGRDNRECIGYGSGYTSIPYFDGGVGVECFWAILRKAGYTIEESHTKRADFYRIGR